VGDGSAVKSKGFIEEPGDHIILLYPAGFQRRPRRLHARAVEEGEDRHLFDSWKEGDAGSVGHDEVGAGHGAADDRLRDLDRAVVGPRQRRACLHEGAHHCDDGRALGGAAQRKAVDLGAEALRQNRDAYGSPGKSSSSQAMASSIGPTNAASSSRPEARSRAVAASRSARRRASMSCAVLGGSIR
jgi:hypothetical protein